MSERIVQDETPMEFFKQQLESAMEHQRVCTSAFVEHYLVCLLAHCVKGDPLPAPEPGFDEMPLSLVYVRALAAAHRDRTRLLRALGDSALFVSGFFADSLTGKLVDLTYYKAMGGRAYARLASEGDESGYTPSVFSELAGRFSEFADLLAEVSEVSHLQSPGSILKLYERWAQTGSRRAAALLAARGIAPLPFPGGMQ